MSGHRRRREFGESDLRGRWTLETRFGVSTRLRLLTGQQFFCSPGEDQRAGVGPELSRFVPSISVVAAQAGFPNR